MIVTENATPPEVNADAGVFHTDGLAPVAEYASEKEAWDHGLVPLAMGLHCWIDAEPESGRHRLWVEAAEADAVREQLRRFEQENAGWPPPRRVEPRARDAGGVWWLALMWACVVCAVFAGQGRWSGLTEAAAMDARAVFAGGEWWRAFTALFMHADAGHLISNLGGGVFLFAAVLLGFGRARGGMLLACASVAANLAVGAAYYPAEYRSLGASTAVFAALGLVTGRAVRMILAESAGMRSWRAAWVPLGAGATMLMLYGAGAEAARVDVPAHAAGFLAGLLAGFVFARPPS